MDQDGMRETRGILKQMQAMSRQLICELDGAGAKKNKMGEAVRLTRQLLGDGKKVPIKEIHKAGAKLGLSARTIARALSTIGAVTERDGFQAPCYAYLPSRLPKRLQGVIQPDDGLDSIDTDQEDYLRWKVGDKYIRIDGAFTPEELRAIADHMDNATTP